MKLLCIDPGPEVSGAVRYNTDTGEVWSIMPEIANQKLVGEVLVVSRFTDHLVIEMVAAMGMTVGKSTFETVLWTGRFMEIFGWERCTKIYRRQVKQELCGNQQAKDANVRRALLDRFQAIGGGSNPQIGTKAKPGPLYGLSKHAVSALAVGVTYQALCT